jgi:hypothetical protein
MTTQMPSETEGTVTLPSALIARVERRVPRSEHDSAEEYIETVLEEVLARVEAETDDEEFESVDRNEVESRLKSLGYLDA